MLKRKTYMKVAIEATLFLGFGIIKTMRNKANLEGQHGYTEQSV